MIRVIRGPRFASGWFASFHRNEEVLEFDITFMPSRGSLYFAIGYGSGPVIPCLYLGLWHVVWLANGNPWPHSGRRLWWGWNRD